MLKGRIAFPNQFHVQPRKRARSKTAHMRAHTQQALRPAEGTMLYCAGDTWGDVFCTSAAVAGHFAPRGNGRFRVSLRGRWIREEIWLSWRGSAFRLTTGPCERGREAAGGCGGRKEWKLQQRGGVKT